MKNEKRELQEELQERTEEIPGSKEAGQIVHGIRKIEGGIFKLKPVRFLILLLVLLKQLSRVNLRFGTSHRCWRKTSQRQKKRTQKCPSASALFFTIPLLNHSGAPNRPLPGKKRESLNAKRRKFIPQIRKRLIKTLSVRAC